MRISPFRRRPNPTQEDEAVDPSRDDIIATNNTTELAMRTNSRGSQRSNNNNDQIDAIVRRENSRGSQRTNTNSNSHEQAIANHINIINNSRNNNFDTTRKYSQSCHKAQVH